MADYTGIDRPYDALTNRAVGISPTVGNESSIFNEPAQASSSSDPTVGPESYIGIQTTPTAAGAVETRTVITNESIGDVWINTFIRSQNFKPGAMGFNIDGQTGDAEFNNVTVRGTIYATLGEIGGWTINSTTITGGDATLDSTGVITLGTGNDIIKFTAVDSLYRMWVGNSSALSAPFSITKAGAISATSGTIGGNVLSATSIGSPLFVSGPLGKGWNISSTGTAEFQDVTVRGIIRTSVFEKDTISAVNGLVLVSKADALDSDMTALDASTLTITGETTFVANEVIRIKDGTDDEWMLVTDASGAPTYVVTRDLAGNYAADSNPIWKKGTAVVSMGVGTGAKTGFVLLDSSSANSPYIDIYGRNSNTYTDYTLHGRFGWLKGITDADVGLATTDVWGLYTDNAYIKGVIVANTGYIGGTSGWTIAAGSISSINAGNTTTMASGGTNAYIAGTTAAPQFIVTHAGELTATSATITGAITATSGTIGSFTIGTYLYTGAKTAYNDINAGVHVGGDGIGIGNNVFTVSSAGALVATTATITGEVNATSGHIGSATNYWNISAGVLAAVGSGDAAIRAGQTDYDTGTGFWLGLKTGTAKLSMGVGAGKGIAFDGTDFIFRTGATNAARIVIDSTDNKLTFYNASNAVVSQLGGGTFVGTALRITLDTDTTTGIKIDSSVASTLGLNVISSSNVAVRGINIDLTNTGTGNNGTGIDVEHDGSGGIGVDILKATAGTGARITNSGTGTALEVNSSASGATYGLWMRGNNSTHGNPLVFIDSVESGLGLDIQTVGSSGGARIWHAPSSNSPALFVNHDYSWGAIELDVDAANGSETYGLLLDVRNSSTGVVAGISMNTGGAGSGAYYAMDIGGSGKFYESSAVGGSQDRKIRVRIGGTLYYIPCYTA